MSVGNFGDITFVPEAGLQLAFAILVVVDFSKAFGRFIITWYVVAYISRFTVYRKLKGDAFFPAPPHQRYGAFSVGTVLMTAAHARFMCPWG